jgi:2-desacetyl-2-hydroxyethyl bacteriochlorophyllide A dehydrogenase
LTGRVLRFVAPYRVELDEVTVREPEEDELLVRAEASGISSGTEMLAYRGQIDPSLALDETLGALRGSFAYPFAYGYSAVGTVEASRGRIADGSRVFAFHPHQDLFVVRARDVVPVDGLDPRSATFLPLVETALQVCLDAGPRLGEHVAVVGLGCIGLLTAALLSRAGAHVIGAEPQEARRRAAARLGVEAVPPEEIAAVLDERTQGRGVPLVVEASGSPDALADGLRLLAHEGTALVCSWYATKTVPLPLGAEFHRRRLVIRSTQVSTIPSELAGRWDRDRRRRAARALLDELALDALPSQEFPFEHAADAYAALAGAEPGLLHAVLRYR